MAAEIEASVRFVIFFDEIRYLQTPQISRHILEVNKVGGVSRVDQGPTFYEESFGATFKVVAPTVLLLEVADHCWWLNIGGLL